MALDAKRKLSVFNIWGEVNTFCRANWKPLIKSLLILFLVQIALETYLNYLEMRDRTNHIGLVGVGLVSFLISVLIAVTVHRLLLKGQTPNSVFGSLRWTFAETKYALYILALIISAGLLGGLITFITLKLVYLNVTGINVLIGCLVVIAMYVVTRLSLIFPAIAIGDILKVSSAWELTAGNGLKLMAAFAVIPVFFALFLGWVEKGIGSYLDPIPFAILSSLPHDLIAIYFVMCLSFAYKHLALPNGVVDKPLNEQV